MLAGWLWAAGQDHVGSVLKVEIEQVKTLGPFNQSKSHQLLDSRFSLLSFFLSIRYIDTCVLVTITRIYPQERWSDGLAASWGYSGGLAESPANSLAARAPHGELSTIRLRLPLLLLCNSVGKRPALMSNGNIKEITKKNVKRK